MSADYTYTIPITDLRFHQQETNNWCAAACAQMVLHFLSPNSEPIDQDFLRENIENRSEAEEREVIWYGQPDGLEVTLNTFSHLPTDGSYRLMACASEAEVSRLIVWSVDHHHLPAVALVYGMRHWTLVRGFTADRQPMGPSDSGYNIRSFDLYDPWPPIPDRKPGIWPPPHVDVEDGCGSGSDRGIMLNHVSYEAWRASGGLLQSGYMTGVPMEAEGSKWKGMFLAIVGWSAEDETARQNAGKANNIAQSLHDSEPEAVRAGAGIPAQAEPVDKAGAASKAVAALDRLKKSGRKRWQDATDETEIGHTRHVTAIHPDHGPYYIVPFQTPHTTSAAVRIHAGTGTFLGAVASPHLGKSVIDLVSLDEILDSLEGKMIEFEDLNVVFSREIMDSDPPLGWKPCLESMSPFYPFYIIILHTSAGDRELYIRAHDGQQFTRLNDEIAGA